MMNKGRGLVNHTNLPLNTRSAQKDQGEGLTSCHNILGQEIRHSPAWFQKNARNCDEKEPPEVFTKGDELLSSPEILFHIQSPHLQTLPFYIVAPSSSIEECLVFRRTYTEIFWALTFSISEFRDGQELDES
ncbi:unnamed protein product, partial [Vitis vinifera]